ncbi:MAG: hypothetical protein V4507_09400 [Verrucomicrobiota bacterium]
MSQCNTETCAPQKTECGCPVVKSFEEVSCPVECLAENGPKLFGHAMKEVQTEIIKEKIRAAYGPVLEKQADAIVKAMDAHFKAVVAQAKAKKALSEDLCAALSSCCQ